MAWAERAKAGDVGGAGRRFSEGAVVEDPFQLDDDGLEDFVLKYSAAGAFRKMFFANCTSLKSRSTFGVML